MGPACSKGCCVSSHVTIHIRPCQRWTFLDQLPRVLSPEHFFLVSGHPVHKDTFNPFLPDLKTCSKIYIPYLVLKLSLLKADAIISIIYKILNDSL